MTHQLTKQMKEQKTTAEPTLQDIKWELRHHLMALTMVIGDFFGAHAVAGVLGVQDSDDSLLRTEDISHLALFSELEEAYDYAFLGYEGHVFLDPYFELLRDLLQMFERNDLLEVAYCDPDVRAGIDYTSGGLEKLVALGYARMNLDGTYPCSVDLDAKQIALLAGITERSVQNAFSLKGEARLIANRSSIGGYDVKAEEALRWLKDKKGFIPTRPRVPLPDDLPWPTTISSLTELRVMLCQKATKMDQSIEALAEKAGKSHEFISNKLSGVSQITFQDALPLAKALQIDPPTLLMQIMSLCHPDEARLLMNAR